MEYTKKLIYQSNYWYNDGLRKANIRDMSGAIASLKRSLQYNRENIAARNLLGLVYYGIGEIPHALVEWIISKNLKSHENIANYYIKKVQETPSELETVNQAIRKYNQCLVYCNQQGEDLAVIQLKKVLVAHPTFLKAYQLLALLYLQTEQYAKARQMLRKAHKLDTTNDITLSYMHELNQLHNKKVAKLKEDKEQTVTYNLGNETIIQPVSSSLKDNAAILTIVNILIGIVLGAAVVWFLITPAVNESKVSQNNKEIASYSEQIATQKSEISALKKELDSYRSDSDEAQKAKETAASTQKSYEKLISVSDKKGSTGNETLAKELLDVNKDALGSTGKELYDSLAEDIFVPLSKKKFAAAKKSYDVANYGTAVEYLELVVSMDETYEEGQALLLLGDAYAKNDQTDQAEKTYKKLIELLPDSEAGKDAQKKVSTAKKSDTNDPGNGTPDDQTPGGGDE